MNRLEKQFVLMAGVSVTSLAAFFGYFFFPRSLTQRLPGEISHSAVEPGWRGFVPVTGEWGISFQHQQLAELPDIGHITGSGVALGDFNGDGWTDIYLLNSTPEGVDSHRACALYLNRGGGRFDAAPDAGGANPGGLNMGVVSADYDADGDLDLYITRVGPDRLFRNDGLARFEDVTEAAKIDNRRWGTSAAFADYDRDGDLDLFVVNYLTFDPHHLPTGPVAVLDRDEQAAFNPYLFPSEPDVLFRNEGDGTFTDVTGDVGITDENGKGLGAAFVDLNDDAWPDVYVVNDVSPNTLYANQADGTFKEIGVQAGVADPRGGMGITVGDYDLDGYLDIFSTHWQDELNVLYRNLGSAATGHAAAEGSGAGAEPGKVNLNDFLFDDVTAAVALSRTGLGLTGWGTVFLDADQDGHLDIYLTNGYTSPVMGRPDTCVQQPDRLLINQGGRFADRTLELLEGVPMGAGRGLAAADLDGDGDLDLVRTANNGAAVILENRGPPGHWLIVQPAGRVVVGTAIRVAAGGMEQVRIIQAGTSFLSSEPAEAHFGLGSATAAARVRVQWPNGQRRIWLNVPADKRFIAEPM